MLIWMAENAATLLVGLAVLAGLGAAVYAIIRNRRKGRGCGHCEGCSRECGNRRE